MENNFHLFFSSVSPVSSDAAVICYGRCCFFFCALFLGFSSFCWRAATDQPQVTLQLGSTLNPDDIKEGDDVYFECQIKANPKEHRITWWHDVSTCTLFFFFPAIHSLLAHCSAEFILLPLCVWWNLFSFCNILLLSVQLVYTTHQSICRARVWLLPTKNEKNKKNERRTFFPRVKSTRLKTNRKSLNSIAVK